VPSRQDQLHSYQYSQQRVVAALVTHDPDPQRSPLRRAGTTALVSLLIASIAVGGAAVYGLLTGRSGADPTDSKVVFQEKGTGARFVYLAADKRLHPVLNYASGMLLASADTPELKSVSTEKLATVQLGPPLGIPGAPDSLPKADALLTGRWTVCTDNQGVGGKPRSTLLVGRQPTDGTVAARSGKALLVRDPAGVTSLVAGNRRFPIPPSLLAETLRVLGWKDRSPWPVSAAWGNAVPVGPDLAVPAIRDFGAASQIAGLRVGQLVTGPTGPAGGVEVVLRDGSTALTDMQARLMQAQPGVQAPVPVANFVGLPDSTTRLSDAGNPDGLPSAVPDLLAGTPGRACITLPVDAKSGEGIRIDSSLPVTTAVTGVGAAQGDILADFVSIPRGKGVITAAAASPTAPDTTGTVSIVTDTGVSYPLSGREVLTKLGYAGVKPYQVPAELVRLLPVGPPLDPVAARRSG
jgi:type VII secretion protein EccB